MSRTSIISFPMDGRAWKKQNKKVSNSITGCHSQE
jgi:hypothetical protein